MVTTMTETVMITKATITIADGGVNLVTVPAGKTLL